MNVCIIIYVINPKTRRSHGLSPRLGPRVGSTSR